MKPAPQPKEATKMAQRIAKTVDGKCTHEIYCCPGCLAKAIDLEHGQLLDRLCASVERYPSELIVHILRFIQTHEEDGFVYKVAELLAAHDAKLLKCLPERKL